MNRFPRKSAFFPSTFEDPYLEEEELQSEIAEEERRDSRSNSVAYLTLD